MKYLRAGQVLIATLLTCATAVADAPKLTPMDAKTLQAEITKSPRGTLVNLWASWCEPCKREIPELAKLANRERPKGVRFFLISGDSKDEAKDASDVLAKLKIEPPVYLLSEPPDKFMDVFLKDWPAIVPTTLLFDKSGKLAAHWLGELKMKDVETAIKKLAP